MARGLISTQFTNIINNYNITNSVRNAIKKSIIMMFKNAGLVGLFTRRYQWRDERGFMIPKHHGGHFFWWVG